MKANLFIKFKGIDCDNDSAVDLAELGESLTGFDSVFKRFAEILPIEGGGVEVKATATEKGSIIVDLLISLQSRHGTIPFESITDFLAFLKLSGSPALNHASGHVRNAALALTLRALSARRKGKCSIFRVKLCEKGLAEFATITLTNDASCIHCV